MCADGCLLSIRIQKQEALTILMLYAPEGCAEGRGRRGEGNGRSADGGATNRRSRDLIGSRAADSGVYGRCAAVIGAEASKDGGSTRGRLRATLLVSNFRSTHLITSLPRFECARHKRGMRTLRNSDAAPMFSHSSLIQDT